VAGLEVLRNELTELADALARSVGIEVTVVDSTGVRLAGTGQLAKSVGLKVPVGAAFYTVVREIREIFIGEPGVSELCRDCRSRLSCSETAVLSVPIVLEGEAIGVISLVAFNARQRFTLLSGLEGLRQLLTVLARMLACRVRQEEVTQRRHLAATQLRTILNALPDAVVTVDSEGKVTHFNASAERVFRRPAMDVVGRHVGEVLPQLPLLEVLRTGRVVSEQEFSMVVDGRRQQHLGLIGTVEPIMTPSGMGGVIGVFRTYHQAQRLGQYVYSEPAFHFEGIITRNPKMKQLIEHARRIAKSRSTVLITGESGTGKGLFARAIHNASPRAQRPFRSINCSAIPESLLESELFGYEEGAFTGARRGGKPGKFELADGGTLMLDEIADMPLHLQAKLLKVLEEGRIERVGGTTEVPVDVRVIAASNRDLAAMVEEGSFRRDLYYRLNVIPLHIPPLRERKDDIDLLLKHFVDTLNVILERNIQGFTPAAKRRLLEYPWPGNVRELRNAVEYAFNVETSDLVRVSSLPPHVRNFSLRREEMAGTMPGSAPWPDRSLRDLVREFERRLLRGRYRAHEMSTEEKKRLAEALGISLSTLYRKIES